jgi:hypothetical protein
MAKYNYKLYRQAIKIQRTRDKEIIRLHIRRDRQANKV